jgi:hypothetical protein
MKADGSLLALARYMIKKISKQDWTIITYI